MLPFSRDIESFDRKEASLNDNSHVIDVMSRFGVEEVCLVSVVIWWVSLHRSIHWSLD